MVLRYMLIIILEAKAFERLLFFIMANEGKNITIKLARLLHSVK